MNLTTVGEGKVVLLSGGGKCFTDIAARFCRSEKDLDRIVGSEYDKKLVSNILSSGHLAATEFDYFIFGVEGYSRVTEAQLIRKRLASYLIKSGRVNKNGKRSFDIVLPNTITNHETTLHMDMTQVYFDSECTISLKDIMNRTSILLPDGSEFSPDKVYKKFDTIDILGLIESWYDTGVEDGLPEEDLRYVKPEGTEFKAIVGMNAHALIDWFKIRCCKNAQTEIRDLAWKMCRLCKEASPDLFKDAGPSCFSLGYCPENARQHKDCTVITKDNALKLIAQYNK